MQRRIKKSQEIIQGQLASLKNQWSDAQMERFESSAYLGNFNTSLNSLISRIDKANGFLENKYSTLETHRN